MTTENWIALVGTVGIGALIAAILTRWSVISNLRQDWINALRDDLATYLKEIAASNYWDVMNDVMRAQESLRSALLVYHRILLRLNLTEKLHIDLAEQLKGLLRTGSQGATNEYIDTVLLLARQVLKREWEVTKYGIFAKMLWRMKEMS